MRNPVALAEFPFDLLVIGAGVQGAGVALAAARRGLRTALIDQGDFGHAASASSLKVIHGGLRYLQHLDFARMRESIRARSELLRQTPHLVTPRAFLMPTEGMGLHSRAVMRAALLMNDCISFDRNRGLDAARVLPPGRILSRAECLARLPGLDRPEITGAALWHDGFAEDTERLTLEIVRAAAAAGAVVANYVRAQRLLQTGARVTGVAAQHLPDGATIDIRAHLTLWTGGAALSRLAPELAQSSHLPASWVRAYNLVTRRPWPGEAGAALEGTVTHRDPDAVLRRRHRNLFFVPWRGGTMVGTWYDAYTGDPAACSLTAAEIRAAVDEVRAIYPAWDLQAADVSMSHVGVLPARAAGSADPDKHTRVAGVWHGSPPGLVALQAVKYTTGLTVGEWMVAQLIARGLFPTRPLQPPGAPPAAAAPTSPAQVLAWCRERNLAVDAAAAARLAQRYGPRFAEVLELAPRGCEPLARLAGDAEVLAVEVRHAVRREAALHLADIALRRTGLGTFAVPKPEALQAAAAIMADELHWDAHRRADEVAALADFYKMRGL